VDVLFNSELGLADLLLNNPLSVEKFALDASDVTPGTGTAVTGFSTTRVGDRLRLDWGINGITGSRTSNAGDGFYRIRVDGNADGDYADAVDKVFEFARILGDANGDAIVDSRDQAIVGVTRFGANLNGDIDGSYALNPNVASVNTLDRALVNSQLNRRLTEALKPFLDD